jgi:NADH-quinone oxidoreductase subunit E
LRKETKLKQRVYKNLDQNKRNQIKKILKINEKDGNIISILQQIQDSFGYLPENVLKNISKELKIPLSEIYGIATFYAQFTFNPEGKIAITTCDGTACHVQGGPLLKEYIENNLEIKSGETTEDGLFSLKTVACIGCCAIAPAIIVNEEVHGNLTFQKISKLMTKLKKRAQTEV